MTSRIKFFGGLLFFLTVLCMTQSMPIYAAMNDYCVTPPFVVAGVKPNLMLMIDNSASQYDLEYQDTTHTYCANDPTTSCTPGATCSGPANCLESFTTTTTTTYSALPCTADSQCPNSSVTYKAKSCTRNLDCTASGSKCSAGFCTKCNTSTGVGDCVVATTKCYAGFCTNCNTSTGSGDCASTTSSTYSPISCAQDSTCSAITTGDTCNNKCNATRQCYDTTYTSATTYYGYFDATVNYIYDLINDKFTSGATMPGSCTYSAGTPVYVCVNTSGDPEAINETDGFVASGNFLNWLTASKFDVQKKILTGGKFDATNNILLADSRGCAGRKFIKAVSGVDLTFAIRGGTPGGISSTQSLATEYGQTYIEIYTGTYNTADCLNAMYDWINYDSVNLGSFQNDTKGCVGAGNAAYNAVNVWNHILHDCYNGMNDKAQGYSTNLGPLEGECRNAYASGVLPSSITDPNSGIAICSSVLSYVDPSGNPQTGYLGHCWDGTNFTTPCDVTQMENYCVVNSSTNPVVDPSSTVLPGAAGSAPGFIMEQGLMNTNHVGTLIAKVGFTPAPTGLIDKYKDLIRFGTMTFNYNGSASESGTGKLPVAKVCSDNQARLCFVPSDCASGSCITLSDRDGSRIISYIGIGRCSLATGTSCIVNTDCPSGETCNLWVGDHTSGLINQIDSIVASTWTPLSEASYNVIGYYTQNNLMRVTSTAPKDFETNAENSANPNPIQYKCQKNNALLITDGMSTADQNSAVITFVNNNNNGGNYTGTASASIQTSPSYFGSINIDQLSWYGCNFDGTLNSCTATLTNPGVSWTDHQIKPITTHVVYSGTPCLYKDNYGNCCSSASLVSGRCAAYADEKLVPERLMQLTAQNGGGTYTLAQNPQELYDALDNAFQQIAGKAASGTAASVLASGEGSGANLVQAIFYPERSFGTTKINWTGSMKNLWYYIDPQFGGSSIREDTPTQDHILNLIDDHIVRFFFDTSDNTTKAHVYYDSNGDGVADSEAVGSPVYFESVNSLWEAGSKLWGMSAGDRKIYTTTDGTTRTLLTTPLADASSPLISLLQAGTNKPLADRIISYTLGTDYNTKFCSSTVATACTSDTDCPAGEQCVQYRNRTVTIGTDTHTWKLGDIVNSTPRILSWVPANTYHKTYNDRTYQAFTETTGTTGYKSRGTVFVGANDGMMHGFKLGQLKLYEERYKKAELVGTDLGTEQWAYIPQNVLPYLKYLADPNYCHLYSIDATPVIFDASIGSCASGDYWECAKTASTWKTILIGGMRFGGACKNSTTACTRDMNGDGVTNSADCVHTPVAGNGYSSYFALDITNPADPQVLWEFSSDTLGFSTTGPAIVRIAAKKADGVTPDNDKNGRWFAVFGSGPTGPIDTGTHQFKGYSDQPLKLFIVDLKNGPTSGNFWSYTTGLTYAFAGSMINGAIDFDQNNSTGNGFYQDDAVYLGYTRAENIPPVASSKWNVGGVLRLFTHNSLYPDGTGTIGDSTHAWAYSTVISGIGPVTSAVAKIQDYAANKVWLYFGTGRYFYKSGDDIDDGSNRRTLYGVREPCYTSTGVNFGCTTSRTKSNLGDAGSSASTDSDGWYIDLDGCTTSAGTSVACTDATAAFKTERSVTDPLATGIGVVFFTTTKPSADVCQFGGGSHLWAVKYDTGWTPSSSILRGRAILQVSTGSIEEINLKDALVQKDGRRTDLIQGIPSGSLPGFQVPPKPINKIIHIREE